MALGAHAAVLTAIREVLDDGAGSLRTIASSRFADALTEDVAEQELARRGAGASKPFRVRYVGRRRHPASPPINSNRIIRTYRFDVVVSRSVSSREQLDPDTMAELEASVMDDADAIEQALCTPPNLLQTVAGVATGICGDCARYLDHSAPRLVAVSGRAPSNAQRFEVTHRIELDLLISPATS